MKKRTLTIICIALAVVVLAGAGVYAASNFGTQDDPLITLSYLTDKLTPELLLEMQGELTGVAQELEADFDAKLAGADAETYKVVTLTSGQRLTGAVGCEIMLRVGSASASGASEPALVDVTSGGSLKSGAALTANHLCMVTIEGNGITASAATVKVLVRGSYTLS